MYKKIHRRVLNQAKKIYKSGLLANSNNKSKRTCKLIKPNRKINNQTNSLTINNQQVTDPKKVE